MSSTEESTSTASQIG